MAEVVTKNWYVVRAVSGQEAKIKDYIVSEISRLGYANLIMVKKKLMTLKQKLMKSKLL